MIVPIKWVKDYLTTHKTPKEIAKSFTEIGLMLDRPIMGEVLDLEHRMDRSDWLSMLGCARDFAAFEKLVFNEPELKSEKLPKKNEVEITIKSEKVNKFRTRIIKNIKVGESPEFIKERLVSYGLPVINNVVDITNFVMVEYGQPLHAQDLNKFEKKEIVLRDTERGETIQTLDSSQMKLEEGTLVLSENHKPICIGGIVGGLRTGVTESTTEIILDSGNYDQASIRKASRQLNIRNETVSRSEKFLSPEVVDLAIVRATDLILEYAGGEAFENDDFENFTPTSKKMVLTRERLAKISGEEFYFDHASDILDRLNYEITSQNEKEIHVKTPYFRTDIEVEDDVVSDILRIYGYSKIEAEPIKNYPPVEITPEILKLEEKVTNILVSAGFHEHITDPFVKFDGNEKRILLFNSVNSDKDSLRLSLQETLNNTFNYYQKQAINEIKLFEVGNRYFKSGSEYVEERSLGIMVGVGDINTNSLKIRETIDLILSNLGIINYHFARSKNGLSIMYSSEEIGFFNSNYAEVNLKKIQKLASFVSPVISEFENLSKEDLTFTSHIDVDNGEIIEYVRNINPLISKVEYVTEFISDSKRKVSFRYYSSYPQEMKKIREEIIINTHKKYGVEF